MMKGMVIFMFENRFYTTDKMLKEYVNKVICKNLIIAGSVITIVGMLLCVVTAIDEVGFKLGVYVVATFIVFTTTLATPLLTFSDTKKRDKALNNGQKNETVVLFDDKIYMSEGSFKFDIEYERIEKIHILSSCCVLMFGKTNGIMIEQNSFTNGTFEEFLDFIKPKCENITKKV